MNQRFQIAAVPCLLLAIFILAGGWIYWQAQDTREAWILLDPAKKSISEVSSGQKMRATFRLKNASSLPRRIFGGSVC